MKEIGRDQEKMSVDDENDEEFKAKSAVARQKSIDEMYELLGPPLLLDDEESDKYKSILHRVWEAVGPVDFLERIMVREYVDNVWEMIRIKQLKNKYWRSRTRTMNKEITQPIAGRRDMVRVVGHHSSDRTYEDVFVAELGVFERFETFIARLDVRRSIVLREMDIHAEAKLRREREIGLLRQQMVESLGRRPNN